MAAMKHDGDRSVRQQPLKAHDVSFLVGKMEGRHRLAELGSGGADTVAPQASHHSVDGFRKIGPILPHARGEGAKLLLKGSVHGAQVLECLLEVLPDRIGRHSAAPMTAEDG